MHFVRGSFAALGHTRMNFTDLRTESTWRLLLLSIVTYAVYPVHFLRRLTTRLNENLPLKRQISAAFIITNFVFAYGSLLMLFVYLFLPEGHPAELASSLSNLATSVLMLVWSFKVQGRLNQFLVASGKTEFRLWWFTTFLFQWLYINYKINAVSDEEAEQSVQPDRRDDAAPG
jgi:Na+/H+ antiporter NhaD/arsenite permease-like protein